MTIFLSGGAKNGKSSLAQDLAVRLADGGPRFYVATIFYPVWIERIPAAAFWWTAPQPF